MAELDTSQKGGHGKKGGKKRSKKASTRIDLTPMVDLGFLLVTFFMLTTTFKKPQTMEINMPINDKTIDPTQRTNVKESNAFTILIDGENKLYWYSGMMKGEDTDIHSTNYSATGLRQTLLQKKTKELVVMIKPSDKANYKNVVDVLDEMNITDISKYALVDISPDELKLIKDR
jgi:biopolymer transport protein ExbD